MTWPIRNQFAIAAVGSCALHVAVFLLFSHTSVEYRASRLHSRGRIAAVPTKLLHVIPVLSSLAVSQPHSATLNNKEPEHTPPTTVDTDPERPAAADDPDSTVYLPTDLLEVGPVVIEDIPGDPPELQGRSESGTMVLTLLINANGTVDQVIVESSDLPDIFAEVARRDFLTTRFSPGVRNGLPVPTEMRIELSTAARD